MSFISVNENTRCIFFTLNSYSTFFKKPIFRLLQKRETNGEEQRKNVYKGNGYISRYGFYMLIEDFFFELSVLLMNNESLSSIGRYIYFYFLLSFKQWKAFWCKIQNDIVFMYGIRVFVYLYIYECVVRDSHLPACHSPVRDLPARWEAMVGAAIRLLVF